MGEQRQECDRDEWSGLGDETGIVLKCWSETGRGISAEQVNESWLISWALLGLDHSDFDVGPNGRQETRRRLMQTPMHGGILELLRDFHPNSTLDNFIRRNRARTRRKGDLQTLSEESKKLGSRRTPSCARLWHAVSFDYGKLFLQ